MMVTSCDDGTQLFVKNSQDDGDGLGIEAFEICGLLGNYTASCGNYLPNTVNNYHTTPCNTPEDHRFHQHRGGSLKSRIEAFVYAVLMQMFEWLHGQMHRTMCRCMSSKQVGNYTYHLL
jgi:hypothetical protein